MAAKAKRRTVLVTGGSGRLGHALISQLISEGASVRALIRDNGRIVSMPSRAELFVGDICDHTVLRDAFRGVDTVYHLAAAVSQDKFSRRELMRVNVKGTKRVISEAEHSGAGHIIFSSSVDVYGNRRTDVLNEESALRPSDMYGYSKVLAEQSLRNDCSVNYTIMRIAAIYGSGFGEYFFKVFNAIKRGKLPIIGNGKNKLSLVHVDDVVDAFSAAGKNPKGVNNIFNLSDGKEYTQEYLFRLTASLLHTPAPKRHMNAFAAAALARLARADADEFRFITSNRIIDISKIRNELKFKPAVNIREGGRKLVKEFVDYQNSKDFLPDM